MTSQKDAYAMGVDEGYSIAWSCELDLDKVGEDHFMGECLEAEENGRQYSPFEFTASDFNSSRNPDEVWDAYDEGLSRGIRKYIAEQRKKPVKKGVKKVAKRVIPKHIQKPVKKPVKRVAKRTSAWYFDPNSRVNGGTRPFYIVTGGDGQNKPEVKVIQMQETSTQKGIRSFKPGKF